MTLQSIDLELGEIFSDPERRQAFFRAITQDDIASGIRELRKLRSLTQSQLADKTKMKQSAISRIEQAKHASWSLVTLFRVADALDAHWRISLQPIESEIDEIQKAESSTGFGANVDSFKEPRAGSPPDNLFEIKDNNAKSDTRPFFAIS